jgi:peptidoglycan hydrolase-like protein with peptidoglycan-binding domain
MFRVAFLGVLALAACSQPSQPAAQVPAPPVQSAAHSAAQTEAQASTRDSSATRDQIKGIQGRLTRDGFYHGPIDGVWGPATAGALGRYQRAHGLEPTEKLDHETLESFTP